MGRGECLFTLSEATWALMKLAGAGCMAVAILGFLVAQWRDAASRSYSGQSSGAHPWAMGDTICTAERYARYPAHFA